MISYEERSEIMNENYYQQNKTFLFLSKLYSRTNNLFLI